VAFGREQHVHHGLPGLCNGFTRLVGQPDFTTPPRIPCHLPHLHHLHTPSTWSLLYHSTPTLRTLRTHHICLPRRHFLRVGHTRARRTRHIRAPTAVLPKPLLISMLRFTTAPTRRRMVTLATASSSRFIPRCLTCCRTASWFAVADTLPRFWHPGRYAGVSWLHFTRATVRA